MRCFLQLMWFPGVFPVDLNKVGLMFLLSKEALEKYRGNYFHNVIWALELGLHSWK